MTNAQNAFHREIRRLARLATEEIYGLDGSVDLLIRYLLDDGGGYLERERFFPIFRDLLQEQIDLLKEKTDADN